MLKNIRIDYLKSWKNMLKKVIQRIPGEIPPSSKKESQGFIEDLRKKQKFELEELLERQNKILANKKFIMKLDDKGQKILEFREKILKEIEYKNEVEQAANLLSRLNLVSEGKAAMSELEWTGKYSETRDTVKIVELDSDNEEDPLKILAQPTGSGVHKKKIICLPPEESLIKPEDLVEIESFEEEEFKEAEHVKYILNKVENPAEENDRKRKPFKPYKTTKSDVHDPEKEKQRKTNKNWEVTAATPPLIVHGAIKVVNLNESLLLQKEHKDKLQIIQTKHAAEKLAESLALRTIGPPPENVGSYQLQDDKDSSSPSTSEDEDENEVHDDEDYDKRGTVVFTVDSIEH